MIRAPPRSTRTDTPCPYTSLFRSHALAPGRATVVEHGRGTRGVTAVVLPLKFQVGARTLWSISRRLVRVPLSLADVLEPRVPPLPPLDVAADGILLRSAERRVGKACVSTCRSRWSPYH